MLMIMRVNDSNKCSSLLDQIISCRELRDAGLKTSSDHDRHDRNRDKDGECETN